MNDKGIKNKEQVIQCLISAKGRLSSLGVKSISLFGSFATGNPTPTSDVDLLVEFFEDKRTFDNFMELSFFLEDILGRKVEIVTVEALSPHIGPHILCEAQRVAIAA